MLVIVLHENHGMHQASHRNGLACQLASTGSTLMDSPAIISSSFLRPLLPLVSVAVESRASRAIPMSPVAVTARRWERGPRFP